ncbi:hypothetical protein PTSG_11431 [Salpingoeca rosetta]|uniref:BEACH domain-containing protein n=1 Tax=Salpingoeca rosetta (strain ATCC 50818 / BSB-021) TaxID=946362 RepID=F2UTE5_SALR5|nr:uncharacterized protein PTSG_11431 [Salpingoeca rosetta]EGD82827.1 hypothetical protein PTSG_11431 [Salpingoeca rosetta]|eukprot:XP_004987559.1 hypothetical protein PTSG_11431 [Salpingoeca rosetta]
MIAWQNGAISNFDYLMYLNNLADRSFTDLAQYPVFPWVIKDYTSDTLDLENPETFRDLSKPMGAQNPERLKDFINRYNEMPAPKFHYGTHYSTPGYVLFYTLRAAPEYSLNLQNGKFDAADRLFRSIADTWNNAYSGMADVKELIPEFYMQSTDFLLNLNNLDLGVTQRGERVGDVILPPWADSAADFLAKCREALECDYVSQRIHHWIDLIFGYKQTGPEAVKAHNLFYYLTYEGELDLDAVSDPAERKAFEVQIMEFGQTPRLLFSVPHPQRRLPCVQRPLGPADASAPMDEMTGDAVPSLDEDDDEAGTHADDTTDHGDDAGVVTKHLEVDVPLVVEQQTPSAVVDWSVMLNLTHMATLPIHREGITGLALSHDSNTLFSVSQDSKLKVHDLRSHEEVIGQRIGDSSLSAVLLFPDNDTLLVASWDSCLYLYSVELGSVLSQWQAHHDAVSTVKLFRSSDDNRTVTVLSASWDGSIKVWELESDGTTWSYVCVSDLGEHAVDITALAVHPERQLAISGDNEGHMAVWDLADYTEQRRISDLHFQAINDLCFTPDGKRLITCSSDCTLKVVLLDSLVEAMVVTLDQEPHCIATDGTFILVGCEDGAIELWDSTHRTLVQSFRQHKAAVRAIAVASDASCVVSGDEDACFTHWIVQDADSETDVLSSL